MKRFISKNKSGIVIAIILITIGCGLTTILFTVPSVSSDPSKGHLGEMSAWFDLMSGLVITIAGFFLAMQFDDIVERKKELEHELEFWTLFQESIKMIRMNMLYRDSIWLKNQCQSMRRLCEIDTTAMFSFRKSPFYKELYSLLIELDSMDIGDTISFLPLSKMTSLCKVEMERSKITRVYMLIVKLILLSDVDYQMYSLYQDDKVVKHYIQDELERLFAKKEALLSLQENINTMLMRLAGKPLTVSTDFTEDNIIELIDKTFCCKLKITNENSVSIRRRKKRIISQIKPRKNQSQK